VQAGEEALAAVIDAVVARAAVVYPGLVAVPCRALQ